MRQTHFDQSTFLFEEEPTHIQEALGIGDVSLLPEESSALARGVDQLQASLYGFVSVIGDLTGFDTLQEWGEEGVLRNIEELKRNPPEIHSWDDVDSLADFGTYWAEAIAEQAPQLLMDVLVGLGLSAATFLSGGTATPATAAAASGYAAARAAAMQAAKAAVKNLTKEQAASLGKKLKRMPGLEKGYDTFQKAKGKIPAGALGAAQKARETAGGAAQKARETAGGLYGRIPDNIKDGAKKHLSETGELIKSRPAAAGLVLSNVAQNTGETQMGFITEGIDASGTALIAGIAKGAIDSLPVIEALKIAKKAKVAPEKLADVVASAAKSAVGLGLAEGGTEAVQTIIDHIAMNVHDESFEMFDDAAWNEIWTAATKGALVGGTLGGTMTAAQEGLQYHRTVGGLIQESENEEAEIIAEVNRNYERAQRVNEHIVAPPSTHMAPEPQGTIDAQAKAVADPTSSKDTMEVTAGSPQPTPGILPEGIFKVPTANGVAYTTNREKALLIEQTGGHEETMGKVIFNMPGGKDGSNGKVVVGLNAEGYPVYERITSDNAFDVDLEEARRQTPDGGRVIVTTPDEVLQTRMTTDGRYVQSDGWYPHYDEATLGINLEEARQQPPEQATAAVPEDTLQARTTTSGRYIHYVDGAGTIIGGETLAEGATSATEEANKKAHAERQQVQSDNALDSYRKAALNEMFPDEAKRRAAVKILGGATNAKPEVVQRLSELVQQRAVRIAQDDDLNEFKSEAEFSSINPFKNTGTEDNGTEDTITEDTSSDGLNAEDIGASTERIYGVENYDKAPVRHPQRFRHRRLAEQAIAKAPYDPLVQERHIVPVTEMESDKKTGKVVQSKYWAVETVYTPDAFASSNLFEVPKEIRRWTPPHKEEQTLETLRTTEQNATVEFVADNWEKVSNARRKLYQRLKQRGQHARANRLSKSIIRFTNGEESISLSATDIGTLGRAVFRNVGGTTDLVGRQYDLAAFSEGIAVLAEQDWSLESPLKLDTIIGGDENFQKGTGESITLGSVLKNDEEMRAYGQLVKEGGLAPLPIHDRPKHVADASFNLPKRKSRSKLPEPTPEQLEHENSLPPSERKKLREARKEEFYARQKEEDEKDAAAKLRAEEELSKFAEEEGAETPTPLDDRKKTGNAVKGLAGLEEELENAESNLLQEERRLGTLREELKAAQDTFTSLQLNSSLVDSPIEKSLEKTEDRIARLEKTWASKSRSLAGLEKRIGQAKTELADVYSARDALRADRENAVKEEAKRDKVRKLNQKSKKQTAEGLRSDPRNSAATNTAYEQYIQKHEASELGLLNEYLQESERLAKEEARLRNTLASATSKKAETKKALENIRARLASSREQLKAFQKTSPVYEAETELKKLKRQVAQQRASVSRAKKRVSLLSVSTLESLPESSTSFGGYAPADYDGSEYLNMPESTNPLDDQIKLERATSGLPLFEERLAKVNKKIERLEAKKETLPREEFYQELQKLKGAARRRKSQIEAARHTINNMANPFRDMMLLKWGKLLQEIDALEAQKETIHKSKQTTESKNKRIDKVDAELREKRKAAAIAFGVYHANTPENILTKPDDIAGEHGVENATDDRDRSFLYESDKYLRADGETTIREALQDRTLDKKLPPLTRELPDAVSDDLPRSIKVPDTLSGNSPRAPNTKPITRTMLFGGFGNREKQKTLVNFVNGILKEVGLDQINMAVVNINALDRAFNAGVISAQEVQYIQDHFKDETKKAAFLPRGANGVIIIRENKNRNELYATVGHEVGHAVYRAIKDRIVNPQTPREKNIAKRIIEGYKQDRDDDAVYSANRGFAEWFADKLSARAMKMITAKESVKKYAGLADRYFAKSVEDLRTVFNRTKGATPRRFHSNIKFENAIRDYKAEGVFENIRSIGYGELEFMTVPEGRSLRELGLTRSKIEEMWEAFTSQFSSGRKEKDGKDGKDTPKERPLWRGASDRLNPGHTNTWIGKLLDADSALRAMGKHEIADLFMHRPNEIVEFEEVHSEDGTSRGEKQHNQSWREWRRGNKKNRRRAFAEYGLWDNVNEARRYYIGELQKIIPQRHDSAALRGVFWELVQEKPAEELSPRGKQIRSLLDDFHIYMKDAGIPIEYAKDYFPRVYDIAAIRAKAEEFQGILVAHGFSHADALDLYIRMTTPPSRSEQLQGFAKNRLDIMFEREIDTETARSLADAGFLTPDPYTALLSYFGKYAKEAEIRRMFAEHREIEGNKYLIAKRNAFNRAAQEAQDDMLTPEEREAVGPASDYEGGFEATLEYQVARENNRDNLIGYLQRYGFLPEINEVAEDDLQTAIKHAEELGILGRSRYGGRDMYGYTWLSPTGKLETLIEENGNSERLRKLVETAMDVRDPIDPTSTAQNLIGEVQAYESLRVLLFSGVASVPEISAAYARARGEIGVKDFARIVWDAARNTDDVRDIARVLGLVQDKVGMAMATEMYSPYNEVTGKLSPFRKALPYLFKWNGNEAVVNLSTVVAFSTAIEAIKIFSERAKSGSPRHQRYMHELELSTEVVDKWIAASKGGDMGRALAQADARYSRRVSEKEAISKRQNDFWEKVDAAAEDSVEADWAKATADRNKATKEIEKEYGSFSPLDAESVRKAIYRFVDESVVKPTPAMRPTYANHPLGSFVYQLKTFPYGFNKIVTAGIGREIQHRYQEGDTAIKGATDALAYIMPAIMIFTLFGAMSDELRERIKSLGANGTWGAHDGAIDTLASAMDRTGLFTSLPFFDPVWDAVSGNPSMRSAAFGAGPTFSHLYDIFGDGRGIEWNELVRSIPVVSQTPALRQGLYS